MKKEMSLKKCLLLWAAPLITVLHSTSALAAMGASVTLASGQPANINPSETTQLEITLSNNNTTSAINSVAFSNSLPGVLPDGLKIAGAPTYTCTDPSIPSTTAGAGTLTATVGTQAISLTGGIIPVRDAGSSTDGTCTIIIPVTAGTSNGTSQTYNYQIANGAVTGNDGGAVSNSGAVNQSINVLAMSRPVISKSFGSSTLILGGAPTTLTISVSNPNAVALPNFSVTDNFPQLSASEMIQVAATPNATSTCTGGGTPPTFTPLAGDLSISATGGTIAAGQSCTITVSVEARHTDSVYQTALQSNIILGASDFSNDIGIVPLNASAQVRTRSPLNVSKSFGSAALASGQTGTFSIVFTNSASTPLTINSFADNPIDGVGDASYGLKLNADPTMTCTGGGTPGTFARTIGGDADEGFTQTSNTTIAAGQTCTITGAFTATSQIPNVPQSFTNTIPEGAVGTVVPGIVSRAASASILVADELRILKAVTPTNPAPGNPVRYQVTAQNFSASIINNLDIDDTFTNGQTFLTGNINGNDFTPTLSGTGCSGLSVSGVTGDSTATFSISTVPARVDSFTPAACIVTFYTMTNTAAAGGSSVANVVGAGDVCYNAGATCNGAASNSVSSTVNANTLTAAKAFSPAGPLPENAISRMTITLTNLSANDVTSATISDTLPTANVGSGQLRIANPPNAATTCGGAPVITAAAGSTSVTMNGASIPARASNGTGAAGTCNLQVDVTGSAGVYDNTATTAGTETYGNGSTHALGPINTNTQSITFNSSLSGTKFFIPGSVSSGGKATTTVRLVNSGAIPITGLSVTDPLPAGMVLANPVNAQTSCAGATSFAGNAGDSSITMTGGEIAGSGTCDVLFDVVATGGANWINTIPAGNVLASGGVANQTAITGTLNFTPPTGVTIAKATSPSTLTFPGQVSTLTVTLTNGTTPVTGLSFTDFFTTDGTSGAPVNGMRIASSPSTSTTCTNAIVSATPDATSFSVSGASIGASASCTVSVDVTSVVVGGITNFIPIGSLITDQGLSNSGAATTSLTTQGNLGVTKKFTPNIIKPGERSRLRITFYNPTSQPAANVSVTDNLPANVTVPAGANPTTTCSGATISTPSSSQVVISGANLPAASGGIAETCFSEIDVTSSLAGDYTNTIPIGAVSGTIGGISSQNSQPASDILRVKQPLTINKAIGGFTLDSGNPAGFTTGTTTRAVGATAPLVVSLTNANSAALTQANFTDNLPSGLVIAQTPNASTTCAGGSVSATASTATLTLTGATIPASGSCTVSVDVLSNISGTYTNTISASAVSTFEGVTNEEPTSAQIDISSPPAISKEFSPAAIPSGGTSTMKIYLENDNSSAMTLSSIFTDTLPTAPGPVVVAPVPNIVKTCPGVVTATAGSGTVSYANGASIPAGGCEISVDVTASASGVHTNNIPAGALQTNFGNNPDPANAGLTVTTLGYISGRVFQDNDVTPNGTFESATDTALPGESLSLRSGSNCSGALLATTTTSSTGAYIFTGLSAGTYSVCQSAQPSGTANGQTNAGIIVSSNGSTGTIGTASNPTATTSQIVSIVLNGDGAGGEVSGSTGNDFSEIARSSISGRVFTDQNNNGIQNGADIGISGVTIELLDAGSSVISTTTTDSNGDYSFSNLDPGTYSVREPSQPSGTNNGQTVPGAVGNGGTAGTGTIVSVTPSVISSIILPPNTAANDNNFAEIPNSRTVSGSVFLDYNSNAIEDGSEYGISGVAINLSGTDINGAAVSASTTTAADGTFTFTNLPEGTYTLLQPAQPTGTTNGTTTAGTTGGVASNPTATSSQILNLDLTGSNTLSAANLFPEVPGAAPDLTIAKTHAPPSFGAGSSDGSFTITPSNVGSVATSGTITVTDTLPAGMTLASIPTGAGWTCSGSVGATSFTCHTPNVIGATSNGNDIKFFAKISAAATGQLLTNTAVISGGGEPAGFDGNNTATDTVAISSVAQVSGTVWRDANHDRVLDGGEERLQGWIVELLFGGVVVDSQVTAADGSYTLSTVSPGSGYEIRFKEPKSGIVYGSAVTNEQGLAPVSNTRDTGASTSNGGSNVGNPAGADTTVTTGTLQNLTLLAGDNIVEQSLPVDPAGVVYNSLTRQPVQNAVITITGPGGFNPATDLVGGAAAQNVTTGTNGFYQFLLTPVAPAGTYTLTVTTYPGGYVQTPSVLIPSCTGPLTVDAAPNPALIHDSALPPDTGDAIQSGGACPATTGAMGAGDRATTQHYFTFVINPALPSGNVVNNHIPLDPIGAGDIVVTKTTPIVNTNIGQFVPYTITAQNISTNNYSNLDIIDNLPAGFKFVEGSGSIDGIKVQPTVNGRQVLWTNQTLNAGQTITYKMITVVGSGVQPGEYVNKAYVWGAGVIVSNIATASVRIVPDPVFDCTDIIGKVFDDKNKNGYQDKGETGIANVRLATVNGLLVTTDEHGRFHVACADIPDEERGSNFIMKLDERTLPTGYRITTENPRVVRMTRGKMTKLNFGASIHRVVRIDLMDQAFIEGKVELKAEWNKQFTELPEHLKTGPTVVRFAYEVGADGKEMARKRLDTLIERLRKEWEGKECCHEIMIEEEMVFPTTSKVRGGAK